VVSSLDAVDAMTIPKVLEILLEGGHLSSSQMRQVMRLIMSGGATPAQIGGFLMALRAKGETI
jgi:anthranilate phosphoribosyltransferase